MSIICPNTGGGDVTPRVATELVSSDHFQLIKLIDGNVGSTTPIGTSANPFNIRAIAGSLNVAATSITAFQGSPPWSVVGSVVPSGNVAHDAADAGNPVKIGGFAVTSSFPSYVDSGDRINAIFDRGGRLLVQQHAPITMRQNRWNAFVGPLSGTIVASCLTPGGRIIVTDYNIQAGSATAGIVGLYFARSGNPVNITVGSGTALFYGELAPSATAKPGAVKTYTYPEVSEPNDALRISITTSMQVYVTVGYYEAP